MTEPSVAASPHAESPSTRLLAKLVARLAPKRPVEEGSASCCPRSAFSLVLLGVAVASLACGPSPVGALPRTTADPPPVPSSKTAPLPATTTTVLTHEPPPNAWEGETCGAVVCPPDARCDTQMSPRGPQPTCVPLLPAAPGRPLRLGAQASAPLLASLKTGHWG